MNVSKYFPWLTLAIMLGACQEAAENTMVGTLERDRIELSFESSEPIAQIHVADGQFVESDTLLLSQDPSRMQARLERLEAERERAAARLAELERGPREEEIREARALLEASEAETVNAKAELERIRDVFKKGLSTQEALDRAQTRHATAVGQEKARRESLDALLHGTTVEELQQAAAALKSAIATENEARIALERTELRAPMDGRVDKVLARPGERPIAGEVVAVMLDSSRAYARVYVPEHLKASITVGTTMQVQLDGHEPPLTGVVRWVSADASFTPYFALTEHDRSRLAYVAEIDVAEAIDLPSGIPLTVSTPQAATSE